MVPNFSLAGDPRAETPFDVRWCQGAWYVNVMAYRVIYVCVSTRIYAVTSDYDAQGMESVVR